MDTDNIPFVNGPSRIVAGSPTTAFTTSKMSTTRSTASRPAVADMVAVVAAPAQIVTLTSTRPLSTDDAAAEIPPVHRVFIRHAVPSPTDAASDNGSRSGPVCIDQKDNPAGTAVSSNDTAVPPAYPTTSRLYFDNGSIHHVAHDIIESGAEQRVGGPPTHERSSRASRIDDHEVPNGSARPRLRFTVLSLRVISAPPCGVTGRYRKPQLKIDAPAEDNGLGRFITATRGADSRIPPRRHRAHPLLQIDG